MKYHICFFILFTIRNTQSSVIEVSNDISTFTNSTLIADPIDTSKLSISTLNTSAPFVAPIITPGNGNSSLSSISPELTKSSKESETVSTISGRTNNTLLNQSSAQANSTSHESETTKEIKENNVTLSSAESAEPVILIPLRQNSAQSVIIPTLRAYQKYFTPSNPTNLEKRKINAFTDTATPCPICGRMICGSNGNFCPVCLHSGRSNLAAIEKSRTNSQSTSSEEDPLTLSGVALRKRRKNAWRVATLMRPGSLAADQNQMPSELRTGRNLLSWFGIKSSDTESSPRPGQTLDYRPSANQRPAFGLQPDEQIIQKPFSSELSKPTFLQEASHRPQFAKCLYPESPVVIAPQTQISQRVSSFQTILSAFH